MNENKFSKNVSAVKKENYQKLFEQHMRSGAKIMRSDGREFIQQPNETFRQCYDPEHPVRKYLPRYWFISNRGNLLSVKKKKIIWLKSYEGKGHPKVAYSGRDGRTKSIRIHNLVAMAFGSSMFGGVKEIFEERGREAFTNVDGKQTVHGHHILDVKNHPDKIFDADNVQFLSAPVHRLVSSADKKRGLEEENRFMAKMGKVVSSENPNTPTIIHTGETYSRDGKLLSKGNEKMVVECIQAKLPEELMKELAQLVCILHVD